MAGRPEANSLPVPTFIAAFYFLPTDRPVALNQVPFGAIKMQLQEKEMYVWENKRKFNKMSPIFLNINNMEGPSSWLKTINFTKEEKNADKRNVICCTFYLFPNAESWLKNRLLSAMLLWMVVGVYYYS